MSSLNTFSKVSTKNIACKNCEYKGIMGWVSAARYEFKYVFCAVIALLVVAFQIHEFSTQPQGYDHIIYAFTFFVIACAIFCIPFLIVKNSNIFLCPNCGEEIKQFESSKTNS